MLAGRNISRVTSKLSGIIQYNSLVHIGLFRNKIHCIHVLTSIHVLSILMAYITFNSTNRFVIFTIFYFLLFYWEKTASGTALDNQFGDTGDDLDGLIGGRGKLLKGQLKDPDTDRNVVRRIADLLLYNYSENLKNLF